MVNQLLGWLPIRKVPLQQLLSLYLAYNNDLYYTNVLYYSIVSMCGNQNGLMPFIVQLCIHVCV